MKSSALVLLLSTGLVGSQQAHAQNPSDYIQNRIAVLEQEESALRHENFLLTDKQTIAEGLRDTSGNKLQLDLRIPKLEAAIELVSGNENALQRMRQAWVDDVVLQEGKKPSEDAAKDLGYKIATAGLRKAAQNSVKWADAVFEIAERANNYDIRYENIEQLDVLVNTHKNNLENLSDMLRILSHARSMETLKMHRLREMQARYRAIGQELTVLRANQGSFAKPASPPRAVTPAPVAPRNSHISITAPLRASDLVGTWTATGYNCGGPQSDEFIEITYSAKEGLIATKLMGDACIESGEVTWRGTMEGRVIRGRMQLRSPNAAPETSTWMEGNFDVISRNEIRGFGVHFHR